MPIRKRHRAHTMTSVRDETRTIEVMHVITALEVGGAETVLAGLSDVSAFGTN